jgi:hypothetical protein
MSDQFDALFTALRAETMPRVRPPGAESARSTVRRRRTRRMVVAVTTTALAVVGIAVAPALPRLTGGGEPALSTTERPRGSTVTGLVGLRSEPPFPRMDAGDYLMTAACDGAGGLDIRVLLVEAGGERTELAGQRLVCNPGPDPTTTPFRLPVDGDVLVTLAGDSTSAEHAYYTVTLARGD